LFACTFPFFRDCSFRLSSDYRFHSLVPFQLVAMHHLQTSWAKSLLPQVKYPSSSFVDMPYYAIAQHCKLAHASVNNCSSNHALLKAYWTCGCSLGTQSTAKCLMLV